MSIICYPKGLEAFLQGDVDVLADPIRVIMVTSSYVYSSAHDALNDVGVGYRVGSSVLLSGKVVSGGTLTANDVTFASVAGGSTVTALIVYQDTGVESTSRLLAYIDRRADMTPISLATNGGNVVWTWPGGRVLKI